MTIVGQFKIRLKKRHDCSPTLDIIHSSEVYATISGVSEKDIIPRIPKGLLGAV